MANEGLLDPDRLGDAAAAIGRSVDLDRVVCLPELDRDALRATLAALANSSGGNVVLGVILAEGQPVVSAAPGVDKPVAEAALAQIAAELDPPLDGLVTVRGVPTGPGKHLCIATVRQSPNPPHLDPASGAVHILTGGTVALVRSRAHLDSLIVKGRTANERAERLLEAMSERLMLAHHGFYGVGVIACLRLPNADPFLWARQNPEEFAGVNDEFVQGWEFKPDMVRVRPGEVELRLEREVTGILRVNRAGCATAAEIRRRPPGDVLGSPADLALRLALMLGSIARILCHAEDRAISPRLFAEGLRSCRLATSPRPYTESAASAIDMVQLNGPAGDATDATYLESLGQSFLNAICAPFQVSPPSHELIS